MSKHSSELDLSQVIPSIEKLFHYLCVYSKYQTNIKIYGDGIDYEWEYHPPYSISISPTLYTRLDNCHGAGNCCRVPFDLVYTEYDRSRIEKFDFKNAEEKFGKESAERFRVNRDLLLQSLKRYTLAITFSFGGGGWLCDITKAIYIQHNTEINPMSDAKSCPYLFMSDDRYFCGVHVFKPLHCWYPHMAVRVNEDNPIHPSVSIGRHQYGRNHNFGCPVIFTHGSTSGDLFGVGNDAESYFDNQFQSDYEKLQWTALSAKSIGLESRFSYVADLDQMFLNSKDKIRMCIQNSNHVPIELIEKQP